MKVTALQAMLDKHLQDANYQYRGKTWDEIDALAKASFVRLTPELTKKVLKVCDMYDLKDNKLIMRARFMAQTNLFFLCKLLGYDAMSDREYIWTDNKVHNTHEEICNEFFVRKNPTLANFKSFSAQYIEYKERLLLVPRGGFKSTIDMADCVQWIVAFPEVTILILTGVLNLAKDFVGEIKSHFVLEDADDKCMGLYYSKKAHKARTMRDGDPSIFQMLFAEHCIPKDDGKHYEYQTPAVLQTEKECTIFAASIEQSLTGYHVCILKLDDVVTNENSLTVDRLKAVNKQVSINQAMLHPYGFYDKIGTWYDTVDTYGQDIKNRDKYAEEGEDFPMKIYIRACWWANEAAVKAGKIEEEMTEGDYVLWFDEPGNPHSLTYKLLRTKKKTDAYFAIKYLNDPTQMHVVKFPRELLIRRTIHANLLPGTGMIVTTVDTAYSTKSWADYTVIITALIYGGRFYIIDMSRGRFNEFELPAIIAATVLKWKPKRVCIEESVGVKWLGREIYREMDKLKVRAGIEFISLGLGNKANSKMMKAKPVLRYLGDERLLFSNSCPGLDELYDELSKFGTAESTHDDIVDALAILVTQFASYADMEARMTAVTEFSANPAAQDHYNQMYGLGKHGRFNAQQMQIENPDMSPAEIVGNMKADMVSDIDPLADLFG
jgi:predicted phage terminase large subunit-like protein